MADRKPSELFKCIYLETSTLRESEWPHVSARLEQLFSVAKELGVQVILPVPVAGEREEQWLRELYEAEDSQRKPRRTVQRHLRSIGVSCLDCPSLPDEAELRRLYNRSADEIKERWSIVDSPYTSRSLGDLFKLAAKHQRPFRDDGRGFQDAVIYLSVADHLAADPNCRRAILVASDGDYDSRDITAITPDLEDIILKIAPLDTATEILKSRLAESVLRNWNELQEKATKKLRQLEKLLENFLLKNIAPTDFAVIETVLDVYQLTLAGISNVRTPDPRELESGEEFEISAELELKVSASVASSSLISYELTKNAFYIGNPSHLKTPKDQAPSLKTFEVRVELQARAILSRGEFDKITPVSAKILPTAIWGMLRNQFTSELPQGVYSSYTIDVNTPVIFGTKPPKS